jgi:sortase A
MSAADRDRLLVFVERACLLVGVVCLGWTGAAAVEASRFQQAHSAVAADMPGGSGDGRAPATDELEPGSLLGTLSVPRLGLEAPVLVGDSDRTLDLAVGYLPDTPAPWLGGNTALAGHRDGLFRPLKDIRHGDDIMLATPHGELRYRVSALSIVDPDELWVLEPQDHDVLTLITCHPFYYVGPAPRRFIVHADRVHD